jgi:hypothetical protein
LSIRIFTKKTINGFYLVVSYFLPPPAQKIDQTFCQLMVIVGADQADQGMHFTCHAVSSALLVIVRSWY